MFLARPHQHLVLIHLSVNGHPCQAALHAAEVLSDVYEYGSSSVATAHHTRHERVAVIVEIAAYFQLNPSAASEISRGMRRLAAATVCERQGHR